LEYSKFQYPDGLLSEIFYRGPGQIIVVLGYLVPAKIYHCHRIVVQQFLHFKLNLEQKRIGKPKHCQDSSMYQ